MKQLRGDLVTATLNGDVDIMLHVCNCQGVMGSGIAKQVKERIPAAFDSYKLVDDSFGLKLGTNILTDKVGNMLAQNNYGTEKRHLNYGALANCLYLLDEELTGLQNTLGKETITIGIPYKMGSDRAGGDWEIVSEMVEFYLGHHDLVCYKF